MSTIVYKCPNCKEGRLQDQGDGNMRCANCGKTYPLPDRVCPQCKHVNALDAENCVQCGRALKVVCPRCSTVNWSGSHRCRSCGTPLGIVGQIVQREEMRSEDRFTRMARGVAEQKAADAAASHARSSQWWEQERERQAIVAERLQKQRTRERQMLIMFGIGALVILAIFVVIALINAGG